MATDRNPRRRARLVGLAFVVAVIAAAPCLLSYTRIASKPRTATTTPAVAAGGTYYVGGHVERPGAYSCPSQGASLRRAMEAAGAARFVGDASKAYVLITRGSGADAEVIKAELAPLLREGRGDEPLLPGDQVLVNRR